MYSISQTVGLYIMYGMITVWFSYYAFLILWAFPDVILERYTGRSVFKWLAIKGWLP